MTNYFQKFSVSLQVAFWVVLFSIVLYVSASNANFSDALLRIALVFACHIITFYACYSFIVPKYFEQKKYASAAVALLLLLVILTPVRMLIERHFAGMHVFAVDLRRRNGVGIGLILFSEIAVGAFACLVRLAASSFINQQNMEAMRSMQLESELKFLKAQMSPHFLFNTINNIYSLTLIKSDKAPVFLLKLSGLLRYLLYECDKQVSYQQEETALQLYAQLFELRYHEALNLQLKFNVPQKEKLLEPMLLIPILENAFKHSGLGINEQAYVKLDIDEKESQLFICCENSVDANYVSNQPGGIGLSNIRKRMEMSYPGNYMIAILNDESRFTVKLTIPLL
jgi:hypothetical protein